MRSVRNGARVPNRSWTWGQAPVAQFMRPGAAGAQRRVILRELDLVHTCAQCMALSLDFEFGGRSGCAWVGSPHTHLRWVFAGR